MTAYEASKMQLDAANHVQLHRKPMLRHIVLSRRAHFWIEIIQGKQVSFTGS